MIRSSVDSGDNFLLQLYISINISLACLLWLGLPVLSCLKMVNIDVLSYFGSYREIFQLYPLRIMLTVGIFHMAYVYIPTFLRDTCMKVFLVLSKNSSVYASLFISFYLYSVL